MTEPASSTLGNVARFIGPVVAIAGIGLAGTNIETVLETVWDFQMVDDKVDSTAENSIFNGLDSFGGDGAKWKEALKCLPEHNGDRFMMEKACILVLEKPSGVLFAGMTGAEKKLIIRAEALVDSQNDQYETLLREGLVTYSQCEDKDKAATMKLIARQLMNVISLTDENSLPDLATNDVTSGPYLLAVGNELLANLENNNAFGTSLKFEDDAKLALLRKKATATMLKKVVARYLPQMSRNDLDKMDPESREKMDKSRENWDEVFKLVNVSKCKRVALLSLHYKTRVSLIHKAWIEKYKGRPMKATMPDSSNAKTKEIWTAMINDFKEGKKFWKKKDFKPAFNILPEAPSTPR
jgi:hypothetical protein